METTATSDQIIKKDGTVSLEMGPSHPAMHGTVKITVDVDGETVKDTFIEIGYLHRCFEKEAEAMTWTQIFPYTDRLNYASPFMNNVGYALAVEKLCGIEVPERAQYIRVIVSEISRLSDHTTCIGANAMELGAFTAFLYYIEAREILYQLAEEICGARLTVSYGRIGGVYKDLSKDTEKKLKFALKKVAQKLDQVEALLKENRIFLDRLRNVGTISQEDAINFGITGPLLRATGIDHDLRKKKPYLVYDRFDFDVPVGTIGDNYDRFLVRTEEMRQSMRIIEQALQQMPEGNVMVDDLRFRIPDKKETYNSMEGLINHFKVVFEGAQVPKGEVYSAIEGANGELGFFIISDGSGRPYKCHVRSPCFANAQALGLMLKGGLISDIISTFGALNWIGGEGDR